PPSRGAHIKVSTDLDHADPSGVMPIVCEGQVVRIEPHPDAFGVAVRIRAFSIGGKQILGGIPLPPRTIQFATPGPKRVTMVRISIFLPTLPRRKGHRARTPRRSPPTPPP